MRATNRVYILIFFIPMEYFRLRPKVNAKMNKFGSSCNQCGMINFKQSHTQMLQNEGSKVQKRSEVIPVQPTNQPDESKGKARATTSESDVLGFN